MPDDNLTPTPSTTSSLEPISTPTPTSAPTPLSTEPKPDKSENDESKKPTNNGDDFAEKQRQRRKKEEEDKIDTSKMDPMMAAMLQLYAKLGGTLDRLNEAVGDRLAPLTQKLSNAAEKSMDKLVDKIMGADEAPPEPKDNNSQANSDTPPDEPDAETQASLASQAAPLTPFPDTPKPLQVIDTSGYDQTVSPTQNPGDDIGPGVEIGSQIGKGL